MSLLLFAAVTQYSCINDADVVIADDTHSESNGNLALFFEIPNVATSRSAESSGVTTEGSKEEYAVKSLTVIYLTRPQNAQRSAGTEEHQPGSYERSKHTVHRRQNHCKSGNL